MNIIAEIGTSHGGDPDKALRLIDAAAEAGADTVKFQWVYADEILHPETGLVTLPGGKTRLYDRFKALEVKPDFFRNCMDYARSKNMRFACSPFGIKSLDELIQLEPDFIKIASPELNHIPMLRELSAAEKRHSIPIIISSGVSTLSDIEKALSILGTENVTLLHCITSYPAPENEYNLKLIENLSAVFGVKTGVSDHSTDPVLVPVLASACGASVIEKHITLSRLTDGLDDPVALDPEQFAHMCYCVRQCGAVLKRWGQKEGKKQIIGQMTDQYGTERIQAVLGDGIKRLAPSEAENYGRTNRSLHYMHSMKKGQTVSDKDIGILRTEKILTPGISPEMADIITGKILSCDVQSGEGIRLEHFMSVGQS